ncbi:MAG: type IX secretion system membrane protein PorP/SprF [Cyclobacteriaceae bacterium]
MKHILCALTAVLIHTSSHAQTNPLLGQYFQNLQVYNPAHAGMNDYLDINMGIRQQWAGFEGSPTTMYLSANGILKFNKIQNTTAEGTVKPGFKHGLGGYLLSDKQGPYKQSEISLAYAAHVPLTPDLYLSMGASPGVYNARVDMSDVWVKDMANDQTYQSMMANGSSNTYLHVNMGLSLYSKAFYLSYSMAEAAKVSLSGNKDISQWGDQVRHHILGGYRFNLENGFELMPNAFIRLDQTKPAFYEGGVRARYQKNYWVGASYRNDNTYVGMLGFTFNDKYRLGYSFEYKTRDISRYSNGTHEINLGMRLYNHAGSPSMW